MQRTKKAIALVSGGLDSAIATALAKEERYQIVQILTFDYHQRARIQEINAARKLSKYWKAPHETMELHWFAGFNGALTQEKEALPNLRPNQLDLKSHTMKSAQAVWVPNRNGVFLEIAAGIAENFKADAVIVGFNREEAATFPDNTKEYLMAITDALSYSTANHVQIISPTVELNKREIVQEGKRLDFPFQYLWSCYGGGERQCGICESCMRLKRALDSEGIYADFENADLK